MQARCAQIAKPSKAKIYFGKLKSKFRKEIFRAQGKFYATSV
jgi:hypothetical protein